MRFAKVQQVSLLFAVILVLAAALSKILIGSNNLVSGVFACGFLAWGSFISTFFSKRAEKS